MKKIKLAICAFLICLCLIFSSELFQKYIDTFTGQFYYFEIASKDEQIRAEINAFIAELTNKRGLNVFACVKNTDVSSLCRFTVYANDKTARALNDGYYIRDGQYDGLFSGSSQVTFKDFRLAAENADTQRFYFIGDVAAIQLMRENINNIYASSSVKIEKTGGDRFLITGIWGISGLFLLLFTWFDIQFQKKENFILVSLGASGGTIALKNALIDTALLSIFWGALYMVLSRYIYLGYKLGSVLGIFIISLLLNASLYLTLLRTDFKEVLYGANINEAIVSNCYVLKALTMILTLSALSINLVIIASNGTSLRQYEQIEKFETYSFLKLNAITETPTPDILARAETLKRQIFYRLYADGKAAFMLGASSDQDFPCLVVNEQASEVLGALQNECRQSAKGGYCILVPSFRADSKIVAKNASQYVTAMFGASAPQVPSAVLTYNEADILFLKSGKPAAIPLGFSVFENPVILYCDFPRETLLSLDFSDGAPAWYFNDVMFIVTGEELDSLNNKLRLESEDFYFVQESVLSRFEVQKESLLRIVLLGTVTSVFLLLLEILIIATVVKLEYRAHAMELSIKKILGYSIFKKNKTLFLLSAYAALIGIATVIAAVLMFRMVNWWVVLITGGLLLLFECLVISLNIIIIEKTNVPKILKGGSL